MSFQLTPALNPAEFENFMKELIDIEGPDVFFRKTNTIFISFMTPFYIYDPSKNSVIFQIFLSIYNTLSTDDERNDMVRELLLKIKNMVQTTPVETIEGSHSRDAISQVIDDHIRELQNERVLQGNEINDMIDHYLHIYPPLTRGEMKRKAIWYFYVKEREKVFRGALSPEKIDVLKHEYTTLYSMLDEDKKKEFIKQLKQKILESDIVTGGRGTGGRKRRNHKSKKTNKSNMRRKSKSLRKKRRKGKRTTTRRN